MDTVPQFGELSLGLKSALRTEAARLGFSLFGVTTPDPPETFPKYLEWIKQGYHGTMSYLAAERAIERRADPRKILEGVQSVIVLGFPYPSPVPVASEKPERLWGQIAAYACGEDYHDLLPPRLEQLAAFLKSITGHQAAFRGYTDTGPILERDLAARAGLGWIGKNSCLIDPKSGSYYLLAELFTTLALEPDEPFKADHCGSCRRCIEACPTGCILPDRTLDARRCISYLTIEYKGAIPPDLRPLMGGWVFGCDICQQVCPWNVRFSKAGTTQLDPHPETVQPDLLEEIQLTPQEFNLKYRHSPVPRARRRGYQRNVAVALGNSRSREAIPTLSAALNQHPEPLVRAHSAWALGRIGGEAAKTALEGALAAVSESDVSAEIQLALENLKTP